MGGCQNRLLSLLSIQFDLQEHFWCSHLKNTMSLFEVLPIQEACAPVLVNLSLRSMIVPGIFTVCECSLLTNLASISGLTN